MRALLIGYFTTFGDIEVLQQVEKHLQSVGMLYDVSAYETEVSARLPNAIDISQARPERYTHLFVICGPLIRAYFSHRRIDLDKFSHCVRIGVNLSMIEDLEAYNPFDALVGRDSNQWNFPDLSFREEAERVPIAGLCLVRNQGEYGERQMHDAAEQMLRRLSGRAKLAVVEIDTSFPPEKNTAGLRSADEFESICARLDVMLTTRLHGMVLALKNGAPVIAIDAIAGQAKVSRQAAAIGWKEVFPVEHVTDDDLDASLARCLSESGRRSARDCADRAVEALASFPSRLDDAIAAKPQGLQSYFPVENHGLRERLKSRLPITLLRAQRTIRDRFVRVSARGLPPRH